MVKVGILTCTNVTEDIACSSFGCLHDLNRDGGAFEQYRDKGGAELMGIINCSGCPTSLTPEKVLRRVKSLAVLGVDAIHTSSCMELLCPFKEKYAALINEKYPDIEVVRGTHDANEELEQGFSEAFKGMVSQPQTNMSDLVEPSIQMLEKMAAEKAEKKAAEGA